MTSPETPTEAPTASQPVELNTEQQEAVEAINAFLADPDQRTFGLFGYAGTGKTTTIQHALRPHKRSASHPTRGGGERIGSNIVLSAPTHKAVGALAKAGQAEGFGAELRTIHALLGYKKRYHEEEIFFAPDPNALADCGLTEYSIAVVDECSMVGAEMYSNIEEALRHSEVKVIYMGDPAQLAPVKEGPSRVFALPCARLEAIMRNGGVVQEAATRVRLNIGSVLPTLARDGEDERGRVRSVGKREWLAELVEAHRSEDDVIALAYTNEAVDYINALCRDEICGMPDAPFVLGEKLVFQATYSPGGDVFKEDTTVHQGTVLVVEDLRQGNHLGVPCWWINGVPVLDRQQLPTWRERLALAKAAAIATPSLWRRSYYPLLEGFARLGPGYCTTVHKSQGSTYDRVFVAQHNILSRCRDAIDRNRLLYVAYSRARKELWLA